METFNDWFNENKNGYLLEEYKSYCFTMKQEGRGKPEKYRDWAKQYYQKMMEQIHSY